MTSNQTPSHSGDAVDQTCIISIVPSEIKLVSLIHPADLDLDIGADYAMQDILHREARGKLATANYSSCIHTTEVRATSGSTFVLHD